MNSNLNISEMYGIAPYRTQSTSKTNTGSMNCTPDNSMHSSQINTGNTENARTMDNMGASWDGDSYTDTQMLGNSMLATRGGMQSNIMQTSPTNMRRAGMYNDMNAARMQNTGFTNPGNYGITSNAMQNAQGFTGAQGGQMMQTNPAWQGTMMQPINSGMISGFDVGRHSIEELNGYMRTRIGTRIEAEFVMVSGSSVIKRGILNAVGTNYILITEDITNDIVACDFNQLKFVRFY